jgi:beta-barrel assembly-enhancing protease
MRLTAAAGLLAALLLSPARPAAAVSYQGERELGQRFDLTARQSVPLITDPEVVAYVNRIGQTIARTLDPSYFDYQFAVVRDPRINAFAVPGGWVYVHGGLLAAVKSDDELAAVLGHEIGHVHGRHIVRQQEQTAVLNYTALFGMLLSVIQPGVGSLATAASQAAALQYQREFEQEADYFGARHMQQAGYDPRAMLDFFQQLADQQRLSPTLAPAYLQTHPLSDERLNRLEAVLKTSPGKKRQRPPMSFELQRVQALVRSRIEPPADVLAAYRRVRDQHPNDANAQYLYGVVCLETGELDEAKSALSAARAGGVEIADRDLARLALRQRDAARARDLLNANLRRQPDDAGALFERAKAEEALGDNDAALADYQRALALAPWLATAQHGYGMLAGRAGRQGEGFYHLATAARLNGDYPTALNQYARAQPLLAAGDPRADDARQWTLVLSDYLKVEVPKP